MNYRHAFHAGNFADLAKHALLTQILRAMTARRGSLTVIDTHAGAGLYDLEGDLARRTRESGVDALMSAANGAPHSRTTWGEESSPTNPSAQRSIADVRPTPPGGPQSTRPQLPDTITVRSRCSRRF